MPEKMISDLVTKLSASSFFMAGILALFGAVANYIYSSIHKKTPFGIGTFIGTAFLGFFVGNVVGSFMEPNFPYRDGILMVSGFVCYPILGLIESEIPKAIAARMTKAIRGDTSGDRK